MAKIPRFNGLVAPFAADALGTERTVFGDVTQSNNIDLNLNADFLRGWGIVGPSDKPTKQDFNAMGWTLGQLIAYLYQQGIAEYNAATDYHIGQVVNVAGDIYKSLQNNNTNKTPASEPTWWEKISGGLAAASNAEFFAASISNKAVVPSNFVSSTTGNGYARFGKTILQWATGTPSAVDGANQTITFPLAFPTACLSVLPGDINPANVDDLAGHSELISFTAASCVIKTQFYTVNGRFVTPVIFAVGH